MKYSIKPIKNLVYFLILYCFMGNATVNAQAYISLAPAFAQIKTDNESTRPTLIDLRLGYEFNEHLLELAMMSSLTDDSLNQLTVDVPSVNSIFYRYIPYMNDSIKINLILGATQIDVDYSYPDIADTSDTFNGASFGIGFEEAFQSIPSLKLKLEVIRLYNGDELNINLLNIGVRYVF